MATVKLNKAAMLNKFIRELKEQRLQLDVGFLQEKEAEIAAQNEFGGVYPVSDEYRARAEKKGVHLGATISISPRPFMQQTFDKYSKTWKDLLMKIIPANNYDVTNSLEMLGTQVVSQIKEVITDGDFKENSEQTIAIKGFDKPLVDTGQMRDAIDYTVSKK